MTAFAGAACFIGQSGIWRASKGNLNPETPNPAIGVSPRPWAFFVLTYPSPEGGFADAEKGGGMLRPHGSMHLTITFLGGRGEEGLTGSRTGAQVLMHL